MEQERQDHYETLAEQNQVEYSIQRSRFIAHAYPIHSVEEALEFVASLRKEYYNATHVCWAYAVGALREESRMNDDGEPSGTAGRPIYGQILAQDVSDVLVAVVRYFGGVKLGTGGLIGFAQGESLLECRIRQGQLEILRSAAAAIYGLTCIVEDQDS